MGNIRGIIPTEIDKLAYNLYINQMKKWEQIGLSLHIFIMSARFYDYEEYYDKAKVILRKKKIKKIINERI